MRIFMNSLLSFLDDIVAPSAIPVMRIYLACDSKNSIQLCGQVIRLTITPNNSMYHGNSLYKRKLLFQIHQSSKSTGEVKRSGRTHN